MRQIREKMDPATETKIQDALELLAEASLRVEKAMDLLGEVEWEDHDASYRWRHEVTCTLAHARTMNAAAEAATAIHLECVSWESWKERLARHREKDQA